MSTFKNFFKNIGDILSLDCLSSLDLGISDYGRLGEVLRGNENYPEPKKVKGAVRVVRNAKKPFSTTARFWLSIIAIMIVIVFALVSVCLLLKFL